MSISESMHYRLPIGTLAKWCKGINISKYDRHYITRVCLEEIANYYSRLFYNRYGQIIWFTIYELDYEPKGDEEHFLKYDTREDSDTWTKLYEFNKEYLINPHGSILNAIYSKFIIKYMQWKPFDNSEK